MWKIVIFVFMVLSFGCAVRNGVSEEEITAQKDEWAAMSRSKIVSVQDGPYLGARPVRLPEENAFSNGIFQRGVTLNSRGTLPELCAAVSSLTGLAVSVQSQPQSPGEDLDAQLQAALRQQGAPPATTSRRPAAWEVLRVNYTGNVYGLLGILSSKSGLAWEYHEDSGVAFVAARVKTFTLWAAPGRVNFSNTITNQSKESTVSSVGGASSVQVQDTALSTAQTTKTDLAFDIWEDVAKEVKSLLTPSGSVTMNQAAGTITVRDAPYALRQVERYVEDLNMRLARQVALSIKVWNLEIEDSAEAGLDLGVFFESGSAVISSGTASALKFLNLGGEISAAIVDGKLKNSTALLKGLRRFGNASQVTSGGGVVMSNQPVPIQAIRRDAYLAGSSRSQNEYGDTTTLTPGEVTTGFAMTVIPHILEGRRVVLQYTINLSSLDALEEFSSGGSTIQLPKVSNRSFAQRMTLKMGQTLVLAGFEQEIDGRDTRAGLVAAGRTHDYRKSIIVITISTESGEA